MTEKQNFIRPSVFTDRAEFFYVDAFGRTRAVFCNGQKVKLNCMGEEFFAVERYGKSQNLCICEYKNACGEGIGDYRRKLIKKYDVVQEIGIRISVFCDLYVQMVDEKGEIITKTNLEPMIFDDVGRFIRRLGKEFDRIGLNADALGVLDCGRLWIRVSGDIIRVLDEIVLVRVSVKKVASEFNLNVTFMPKPFFNYPRSGIKVNFSLQGKGKDSFLEGIILHLPEWICMTASTVNSYLSANDFPPYVCYGKDLGIDCFEKEDAIEVEINYFDLLTNPYIAFCSVLQAGIMGVEIDAKLRDRVEELTPQIQKECARLPQNLWESVRLSYSSGFMIKTLGECDARKYYLSKDEERQKVSMESDEKAHKGIYFDIF